MPVTTTTAKQQIVWSENVRYLGVHVVSSKSFLLVNPNGHSVGHSMQFLVALVGHIASEAAIVELLNRKCLPTLLYAKCPLKSADLKSLDYIVVRAFMKIIKTNSKEVAICCMDMFNCPLPSVTVNNRRYKILFKIFSLRTKI